MKNRIGAFSALLIVLVFHSFALADDKVQTEMVANVSTIAAGRPFMVGIKFTIEPGWHIYWENPGDSGLATRVKLNLPEGFTAGKLLFPVPARLELPGDIVNYAYENQVMMMMEITPPKDLSAGKTVTISGKASWLVCQDTCVPGQADISLDLPVAETSEPANADAFKEWMGKLPLKHDADNIASLSHSLAISNGSGTGEIDIAWKKVPADVQFFPGLLKDGSIAKIQILTGDKSTKVTFAMSDFKDDEPVSGLLVFSPTMDSKSAVEISIPCGAGGPTAKHQ